MDKNALISDDYVDQNRLLHEQRERYGANGARYAEHVYGLIAAFHPLSVLDFGCGKGTLKPAVAKLIQERLRMPTKLSTQAQKRHWPGYPGMPAWVQYDPARPGIDALPQSPVDMFISTDVLEHIEPEKLNGTIEYINEITKRILFVTVATRASKKTLPDGRNTHLIVEPLEFWRQRFERQFHLVECPWRNNDTFILTGFKR